MIMVNGKPLLVLDYSIGEVLITEDDLLDKIYHINDSSSGDIDEPKSIDMEKIRKIPRGEPIKHVREVLTKEELQQVSSKLDSKMVSHLNDMYTQLIEGVLGVKAVWENR
jgi:hypothetical protein